MCYFLEMHDADIVAHFTETVCAMNMTNGLRAYDTVSAAAHLFFHIGNVYSGF